MDHLVRIVQLSLAQAGWVAEAAALIVEAFPQAYPDQPSGLAEMAACLEEERIALAAIANDPASGQESVAGFVGAIPQYGLTGWELHPLVVAPAYRGQGIGTALVRRLESEIHARGGITVYLGTDDESGQTSLAGCDLYDRPWERIRDIRNLKGHPFSFYQRLGYVIVGVIPDANGFGLPDILMARRLREPPSFCSHG